MSTERVFNKDLKGLNEDGSPCEACGGNVRLHEWADLDDFGFVEHCSVAERKVGRLALILHGEFCKDPECIGVLDYLDSARRLLPKLKVLF